MWENGTEILTYNQTDNALLGVAADAPDMHPTNPDLFVISNWQADMLISTSLSLFNYFFT
jgi:hypothetical protein